MSDPVVGQGVSWTVGNINVAIKFTRLDDGRIALSAEHPLTGAIIGKYPFVLGDALRLGLARFLAEDGEQE